MARSDFAHRDITDSGHGRLILNTLVLRVSTSEKQTNAFGRLQGAIMLGTAAAYLGISQKTDMNYVAEADIISQSEVKSVTFTA